MVISLTNQLKVSQGDYARTIESASNQIRIMKEQWDRLSRAVGNVFYPILQKILPYINGVLMALTEIFNLLASLLGFEMPEFDYSGLSVTSDAALDLMDNLDGAGESADKLASKMKGLRGFDKLNVINTPSSGGGGSVSGGGGSFVDPKIMDAFNKTFEQYNDLMDSVRMKALDIRDAIMEWLGFEKEIDPVTGKISWRYLGIGKTLSNMWNSFMKLNPLAKVFVGYAIWKSFKKIYDWGSKLIKALGNSGLVKVVKNLIKPFANLGKAIFDGWGNTGKLTLNIAKWQQELGIMDKLKITLAGIFAINIGSNMVKKGFDDINDSATRVNGVLEILGGTATGALGGAITGFALLGQTLGPQAAIIGAVAGGLIALINGFIGYNKQIEETKRLTELYGESIANLDEEKRNSLITSLDEQATLEAEAEKLQFLVDENGKVIAGNEELVQQILNDLNNAYGLNLKLQDGKITKNGDELTSTKDLTTEIKSLVAIKKAEAIQNAYQDEYNEALKKTKSYTKDLTEENARYDKKLQALTDNYNMLKNRYGESSKLAQEAYQAIERETNYHKTAVENLDKTYEENQKTVTNWDALQRALAEGNTAEIERLTKEFTKYQGTTLEEAQEKTKLLSEMTAKDIIEAYTRPTKEQYSINYLLKLDQHQAIVDGNNFKKQFDGMTINANLRINTNQAKKDLQNFSVAITEGGSSRYNRADGGIFVNGKWQDVAQYASGTVNAPVGQMFVARERGPELVGTIGGHTAVMNNDQIVSSVANGVYQAVRSATSQQTSSQPQVFNIYLDKNNKIATYMLDKFDDMANSNGKPIEIGG